MIIFMNSAIGSVLKNDTTGFAGGVYIFTGGCNIIA